MSRLFGLDLSDSGQRPVASFSKIIMKLHVPWNVTNFMVVCVAT